jgi:DNA-binding CsgD family transcriptional regulator/predicted negative regulator of RcsB-dependent stress response
MVRASNKSIVCPVLIGREKDLAALQTCLEQAKRGEGQVALIGGEAGVGKSRLVEETKTYAADQGFVLLQGNCFQEDRAFPYAPFLDLLRSYFSGAAPLMRKNDLTPFAQELSQFLPDATPLLPERPPLILPSSLDPQQEQRRLFALLLHFFTERATHQPLLCILEDLHWSDETSLDLVVYLARNCTHLPLLFVLTYRSDEVSPELRHFLAGFDRGHLAQDLSLQRLTRSEVDAMLRAIFAMYQAAPTGLLESMYALTEGNPFFIEEVLKTLIATGEIRDREGIWERTLLFGAHTRHPSIPRSVQDAVYQRTNQLSAPARQILTLAAVAGRRFDLVILQHVMQIEESQLLVCMKELVAAQLVTEEVPDQFSFRHALTRQAVYAALLAGERRALHRRIAETIEQRVSPPSILDAQLVDLASHFYEAGVWSKAAEYGQRAGERALILYAPRAAVEHLTHTLDALSHLGSAPPATVWRARGQAYETIGEFERARADYERALSIARQTQDGLMEWQSLLDIGFLWAGRDYAQAGHWFQRSLESAQGLADPKLHARSLNRFGNWLVNTGRVADGLHAHQEALAIFETLQDQEGMAETFDLLGMANGIYGDTVQAVEQYDHAIASLRTLSDRQGLISSLTSRVSYASPFSVETTYSVCEHLEPCSRDITEALSLARQVDSLTAQAYVGMAAGGAFASFGELGRGLLHGQESLRIATEIQHTQWMAGAYFSLGHVYLLLLETTLAVQALETGLALARDSGSAWWVGNSTAYLARAYMLQGALPRAEAVLQAVMARSQQPANSPERRISWAWGELALARAEAEVALGIAERLIASTPGATKDQPIPWLLKLKGEALAALARREEAIEAFEQARSGALSRQERPLLWQIDRALGRQYRRLKQEDLAQRAFTSAREGIASLVKAIDDSYLREHFLHASLSTLPREKPASASRFAKEAFGGLTEREREVVRLVSQGKSNGEIADALIVTKRTIETHINNILYKLNLNSRAQIVVWAVESGLVTH